MKHLLSAAGVRAEAIFVALLLSVLVLTGAGCAPAASNSSSNSSSESDSSDEREASRDDEEDVEDEEEDFIYTGPEGDMTVYACELDAEFCEDIEVTVEDGFVVAAFWDDINLYPSESFCDDQGCYFVDSVEATWLFDF